MPRPLLPLLVVITILLRASPAAATLDAGAIIGEMNRVRANPAAYARELETMRRNFHGRIVHESGQPVDRITNEGVFALDDAIAYLRRQPRVGPLDANRALALAANDHARSQAASGVVGHGGDDGSSPMERIERRGLRPYSIGEVIAYGSMTAQDVVRDLIIDDGVYDRGHRTAIFDAEYTRAGAACGPHAAYGAMCVVDLAGSADEGGRNMVRHAGASRTFVEYQSGYDGW